PFLQSVVRPLRPTRSILSGMLTASRRYTAVQACRRWRSATPEAWLRVAQWITMDFILSAGCVVRGPKMSLSDVRPKAARSAFGRGHPHTARTCCCVMCAATVLRRRLVAVSATGAWYSADSAEHASVYVRC